MTPDAARILVLGAGSIGARHARNLISAGARVDVMDALFDRAETLEPARARPLDLAALDGYDGIVVATPTSLHAEHGAAALATGARVLIEKPLAVEPQDAAELSRIGSDRLCVAYNLRFHQPLQQAMSLIHDGSIGRLTALRLWFGSWLPDWRPNVDYRESYSARRSLGGGVLLDAIHELDLLLWALPEARFDVVGSVVARLGSLDIDVEDTAKALLRSNDGAIAIEISLDYLARRYRRGIEATGENATVRLDWARQALELEDATHCESRVADTPVELSYEQQDGAFLAWVAGGSALPVDGATGAASVSLAAQIRDAAT